MAKLPMYQQQVTGREFSARPAPVDNSSSQAIGQFMQGASQLASAVSAKMENEASVYVADVRNKARVSYAAKEQELLNEGLTGEQYTEKMTQFIDSEKNKYLDSSPNNITNDRLSSFWGDYAANVEIKTQQTSAKINAENAATVFADTLDIAKKEVFRDADSYEVELANAGEQIDALTINDEQKAKAKAQVASDIAVTRFEGLIRNDPSRALRELESQKWDGTLQSKDLITLTDKAKAQVNSINASSKAKVSTELQDYIAYKNSGGTVTKQYSESGIKAIYGDEEGAQVYKEIVEAEKFSESLQYVALASPEEINALINKESVKGPEDFSRESKQESSIIKAIEYRNKKISDDPALYAIQNSENVKVAFEQYQATGDGKAFATTIMSEQARLGVPSDYLSVFSKDQAQAMVQGYIAGGETAAQLVGGLREQFGDKFPIVMRDLNRAGLTPTASLVSVLDGSAATYLSQADAVGYKVLSDNVGTDNAKDIKADVRAAIERDYTQTVNATPSGSAMTNQMRQSAEILAMFYLDAGIKTNASDAAKQAASDLVNDRYTFQDKYRVPKKIGSYSPDAVAVERSLDSILDNLQDVKLMIPTSDLPPDLAEQVYRRRLEPKWQTRGDDAGVEMVDQNNQAVLTVEGKKIFYTWQELEKLAPKSSWGW